MIELKYVTAQSGAEIAVVTLNRPEKMNSLNPEMLSALKDTFETISSLNNVLCVVITGKGKAFCAGADLAELIPLASGLKEPKNDLERNVKDNFHKILGQALLRDSVLKKPIIAAVNGFAIAGGLELMMGTDIRVVADDAKFGLQEVKWGLLAAGGGTVRLPAQLPRAIGMEMLLTGDLISAQRAERLGFVNYCVPRDRVLPLAMQIAHKIANNAPLAVRNTRESARLSFGRVEKDALQLELLLAEPVMACDDAREGPAAFFSKRAPKWAKL